MPLNVDGGLLEGIRTGSGNNPSGYPPRTVVMSQPSLDAVTQPAEYVLLASGQAPGSQGLDIGSPSLSFLWSKNQGSVVRFDYDGYARRWSPLPGSSPDVAGTFGNSPRLKVPVPDPSVPFASAPYSVYIGYPSRFVTFTVSVVPTSSSFSNPPAGTVEISADAGELNFGSADLSNVTYSGSQVFFTRQSFFDRAKSTGAFGSLPGSSSPGSKLLINPIPGAGQSPRVRIGYGPYLTPVPYATEASMASPPPGSFSFSRDTGAVLFSQADSASNPGERVYYDGVLLGSVSLTRSTLGPFAAHPASCGTIPAFSGSDPTRYVLLGQSGSSRYYLTVSFFDPADGFPSAPSPGVALVNSVSGAVFLSPRDSAAFLGRVVVSVDTYAHMESGVGVQVYRSPSNGPGVESVPDFVEFYTVEDQIVQDGIRSPFVILPTIPVVDSSLSYSVVPAPGGGLFSGPLADGRSASSPGLGYLLDLDSRQVKFSHRKTSTVTLRSESSSVKLADSAVSPLGFEVTRDGVPVAPGTDFVFNPDGGLVDFVTPVGEGDLRNVVSFSGSALPDSRISSVDPVFSASSVGASIVVRSGPNSGIYRISSYLSQYEVVLDRPMGSLGTQSMDLRFGVEVVADRFYADLAPAMKKVVVRRGSSVSGPFAVLGPSDFSVVSQIGQVTLSRPTAPGEVLSVDYVWTDPGDGRSTVSRSATEFAAFKVRQEVATTTSGTGIIRFNPSGRTVSTDHPITLYVDGVTVEPENFLFSAPGTITVPNSLQDEVVTVNYFVVESPGGLQTFTLSRSPMEVDRPSVASGSATSSFNGDWSSRVRTGSVVVSGGRDLFLVQSSSYDPASDLTTVTFSPTPEVDSGLSSLSFSDPLGAQYMVSETSQVDLVPSGSTSMVVSGRAVYGSGTVVTLDGDPFLAISSSYDLTSGRTTVTFAARVRKNYIMPSVRRSVRPVFGSSSDFSTALSAVVSSPFTLFLDGASGRELVRGLDYSVSDGGIVKLARPASYGDSLYAFYVGRDPQPAGTSLVFNYARAVNPDQSNGLAGQRLSSSYKLLAPDSFFYRVETVLSFLPEVVQSFRSRSVPSSGPNTSSRSSLRAKDQGSASLYFDEQHYGNVDVVVRRLLKLYNDWINRYEDILSNADGRVVGGTYGRFRFDDLSRRVQTYSEIRNDVDDEVRVLDLVSLTELSPFTFVPIPVYRRMYEPNPLSRIFPTSDPRATAALNGNVAPTTDYMKALGSLQIGSVISASTLTSGRAASKFTNAVVSGADTILTIQSNGDAKKLVPAFSPGQSVLLYRDDGTLYGGPFSISSVSGSSPASITVSGVNYPSWSGGIVQDVSDSSDPNNHFYTPGRDIGLDQDSGQLFNITLPLPPPFNNGQVPVVGNEIVECYVAFGNSSTSPRRVPALDGLELDDDGRTPIPPLSRESSSEAFLLQAEQSALALVRSATVALDLITVTVAPDVPYSLGQQVVFLNGPNAGLVRTIVTSLTPSSFEVGPALASADAVGSDLSLYSVHGSLSSILSRELAVLSVGSASAPPAGALIGPIDSEIKSALGAVSEVGRERASGFASAAVEDVLTDPAQDFSQFGPSDYLVVRTGPSTGLYKVLSSTLHTLTIDPTAPFLHLPASGPFQYSIMTPWGFVSRSELELMSAFLSETVSFYEETVSWAAAPSLAGIPARQDALYARATVLGGLVQGMVDLLASGDRLYDTRFLWIRQRTDKKTGSLALQVQARARRVEAQESMAEDHLKSTIAGLLAP
jgi:hypothetical protein